MIELFFLIFVPSFTQELEVCFYVVQVRTSDVAKTHEIQQKYNGHLKKKIIVKLSHRTFLDFMIYLVIYYSFEMK